ncbi:4-hydroxythreonine-4-phosphate dehydrogenase PdxA [Desulfosporosinus sp. SB140]|uniref:4-hydroxythreonine-4-phosphate dehydrogenase PdxA n=1 Tax=Desulfosporosinus paludis TaxID=3115649 RepID=UPI00388EC3BB
MNSLNQRSVVGVTMGDPAGIGPEIVVKALANKRIFDIAKPLVIGNAEILQKMIAQLGLELRVHPVQRAEEAQFQYGVVDVIEATPVTSDLIKMGEIQKLGGQAAFDCIKKSVDLGLAKEIDVIATSPINKEAIKEAGIHFIGHTEIYQELTGAEYALTMFAVRNLRVFFLTRHLSLRQACKQVTTSNVLESLIQIKIELSKLGFDNPKIAVASLNPHAGDGGLFGDEDQREVSPAIAEANRLNINAVGPIPADSVFHLGLQNKFDAILSLYHDQGHIATKTLDFERTISVTLGLPFIRTSVDHGTAFDIAGKGIASCVSMEEAVILAAKYSIMQKGEGILNSHS